MIEFQSRRKAFEMELSPEYKKTIVTSLFYHKMQDDLTQRQTICGSAKCLALF